MIEITSCPICKSIEWIDHFTVKDFSISKESFTLKQCKICTFIITSPQPDSEKIVKYYQSNNYISHSGNTNNLINKLYIQARKYSLIKKLNLVNKLQQKSTILDIGCGTGEFLNILKKDGWKISGVEPNKGAREKASILNTIDIHDSINTVQDQFNIITLWHVLEHLDNINESLIKINKTLSDKGTLIIAVPNHRSADAKHYQEYWAGYDVPRHLWHFNQASMVSLLHNHGFKIKEVIPMKLDAFYVSMLSEKYKASIFSLFKGFWYGLLSNLKARTTGEYSSLIYIAGK